MREQLGDVRQHLDEAAQRELVERIPELAAGAFHARTADADEAHLRQAFAHGADQLRAQRVAGSLAGDDADGDALASAPRRSANDAAASRLQERGERREHRRAARLGGDLRRAPRSSGSELRYSVL